MLNLGFKFIIALEANVHLGSNLNSYFPVQRTVEFIITYEFSICIYYFTTDKGISSYKIRMDNSVAQTTLDTRHRTKTINTKNTTHNTEN